MFIYRCGYYEQALGSFVINNFEATSIRFKTSWIFKAKNPGSIKNLAKQFTDYSSGVNLDPS